MRRLIVIGTAHCADAAAMRALKAALEAARPDRVLLELPPSAGTLDGAELGSPEMLSALRWATARGVPVRGYDEGWSVIRPDIPADQVLALATEMGDICDAIGARRSIDLFCRDAAAGNLAEDRLLRLIEILVDPRRAAARTQAIARSLGRLIPDSGSIAIVCGASHAAGIAAALPDSEILHGEQFY